MDGSGYILSTANAAGVPGPYNGVVGLGTRGEDGARVPDLPILVFMGVISQLERPQVVTREDEVCLFFSTHDVTFSEMVPGARGLYGFEPASGDVLGRLVPLNGHGLVAANPMHAPEQV